MSNLAGQAGTRLVEVIRRLAGPRRRAVALAGAVLATAGSNAPWATFAFGFPGDMTRSGFPGGARLFTLTLVLPALAGLLDVPGRRQAAKAGAGGVVVVAAGNILAIANDGGGFGAVAYGAWLTLAGGALLLAAALSCPADRPAGAGPPLSRPAEWVLAAAGPFLVLTLVVWGLDIEESSRFASYVAWAGFAAASLQALGVFAWLERLATRHRGVLLAAALAAAVTFPFTQGTDSQWLRVFSLVGVFAAASVGLNIVVGLAGLLDLGYVAFLGVGAYVGALFSGAAITNVHIDLPFVVVLVGGSLAAAAFGVVIGAPTLRLRGDYLAIVTLAFGEIFRISVNNMDDVTRGPNGISGVPDLALGGFSFGERQTLLGVELNSLANYYLLLVVLLVGVILVFRRLNDSRIGRAWVAIREDETAAAAMGINTFRLKLLAFAIGAFLAGAAGTVNAHLGGQVSPDSYRFLESITLVAAVVLGGMGTVSGALVGSTLLIVIPEKLRAFEEPRLLLFGLALVFMMRFRPEGLVPSRRRRLELHESQ